MPRSRSWHVAENPGHGCCFSVGIRDAEDNIVADVVYREDGPLLVAAADLYAAARLTLMFHAGGPWDGERAAEWTRLTGHKDATTKILCDFIRAAIAKADGDA